jgi:hypothetical protein
MAYFKLQMICVVWSPFINKWRSGLFPEVPHLFFEVTFAAGQIQVVSQYSNESARGKKNLKIKMAPGYYPDISVPFASF